MGKGKDKGERGERDSGDIPGEGNTEGEVDGGTEGPDGQTTVRLHRMKGSQMGMRPEADQGRDTKRDEKEREHRRRRGGRDKRRERGRGRTWEGEAESSSEGGVCRRQRESRQVQG